MSRQRSTVSSEVVGNVLSESTRQLPAFLAGASAGVFLRRARLQLGILNVNQHLGATAVAEAESTKASETQPMTGASILFQFVLAPTGVPYMSVGPMTGEPGLEQTR